ncbi:MAG TPA: 2-oxoacid:acceptor oxidoreductase subunit alpha [bacterium]|nr:2-oxoacid:acceptor oxidoreductase subunit alpha [bacterium]
MARELSWLIGGKTGEGVDSAGEAFARAAARAGHEVRTFRVFPPVIKGGPTSYEVRIGDRPLGGRSDRLDCVVALDDETVSHHAGGLGPHGLLVVDDGRVRRETTAGTACAAPLSRLAAQAGDGIMRNVVALGVSARLLGLDAATVRETVSLQFAGKSETVRQRNAAAYEAGWRYADAHLGGHAVALARGGGLPAPSGPPRFFLSGNDAIALGALAAGCRLYASYPITPASDILEWMAEHLPAVGGAAVQTEDEIAALGVVLGAGYAGVRAMTATSGPGISLMTETLGLAGMAEIPAVIVAAQRPGPSAGMPTKHEQADLLHLVYASHGEFPRIVLTPGTLEECFSDTAEAFNLAERYQCPVIVAVDQDLVLTKRTSSGLPVEGVRVDRGERLSDDAARAAGAYRRYAITASGISPRAVPGQEGTVFLSTGDAHDDRGVIDVEDPGVRRTMVDKRLRKTCDVWTRLAGTHAEGDGDDILVVTLGAPCGPAREALERLAADGIRGRLLQIRCLWPFPAHEVESEISRVRRVAVVEHNATGQLATLIRAYAGGRGQLAAIRKYDGLPFMPGEIEARLREIAGGTPDPQPPAPRGLRPAGGV